MWYYTQNTPSYLGVLFGTQHKTIALTYNIINQIKAYDTLQVNRLKNMNTKITQHEECCVQETPEHD